MVVIAALIHGVLGGCEQRTEDKRDIKMVMAALDTCNNTSDGKGILEVFNEASIERYGPLVKLALSAKASEIRALGPNEQMEVLRMRCRATKAEVAKMDGRQYVEFATSKGWYVTPRENRTTDTLTDFEFKGDEARARLVSDDERTGVKLRFVKENGAWRYDEADAMPQYDRHIRAFVKEQGMTMDEWVEGVLAEELKKDFPKAAWDGWVQ